MNALATTFQRARAEGRGVLIPYLTAGYPDRDSFEDIAVAILEAGADVLEIGIPFSDPLLDGVAIQESQQRALGEGITPGDCLEYARRIHDRTRKPLLFMGAYNPIHAYGVPSFCRDAACAGVSGFIVPDLPLEEQPELASEMAEAALHLIQLVAPTSSDERLAAISAAASGFIYCISVAGVTGARAGGVAGTARPLVERVRRYSQLPVAVGFGIAGPQQAEEVAAFGDGVIVGSRLIEVVGRAPVGERMENVRDFISSLREALDRPARVVG